MNKFFLYCNSPATSVEGKMGFIEGYNTKSIKKRKGREQHHCYTTPEFGFAKSF